ncbi:MAG: DNA glycosylase [Candidatus Dojkabacteria bacterium]|nr:MAG: DNA glycosylase [Candidatus Dojkabacteria bacterium]
MNQTPIQNYNLQSTLLGGQSFGWDKVGEWFYGFTTEGAAKLKIHEDNLIWQTYPVSDNWEWLSNYLGLSRNYEKIIKLIAKDEHLIAAIEAYPGLRLLEQPFEDTLVGFICSSTKSIPGIRQCVRLMASRYGEKVVINDEYFNEISLFPKLERLHEISEAELRESKVGFRAKYLKAAAEQMVDHDLSGEITKSGTASQAREKLMKIPGVGDKVADCVLVYGLQFHEVTPFDIWGQRFVQKYYGLPENAKYSQMREWSESYLGEYAGWAGQFLFEYIRNIDWR